ncbi:MAG: class I SAM-dependent methyltransferase [Rhodocyclaceae bacterium]
MQPNLTDVPETMLWTLHNRASESMRPDAMMKDPDAERIYRTIQYDYVRSFGPPDASHAVRSMIFDEAVAPWMQTHPGGTVVELGCGLETQFQRLDDGEVNWLCVDVPPAIDIRERFLAPSARCRHIRLDAFDPAWLDEVDPSRGVFVTAQGLFMYFDEARIRELILTIIARLPGVEIMFDTIPPWFSQKTLQGYWRTPHYRSPPMPWGVVLWDVPALVRGWSDKVRHVELLPYRRFRTFPSVMVPLFARLPILRRHIPGNVRVYTRPQ